MRSKGWNKYKLGDIVNIKHGFAFKGEFFSDTPTDDILLTPGNFRIGCGFKGGKFKYYNGEYPEEYILKANDVIVTMTDLSKEGDTLGYSSLVPESTSKRFLHNQRLGLLQFKRDDFDKHFIYWLLRTRPYQKFIVNSASGSTVKHTSPSRIQEYEFEAPDIFVQHRIAGILSVLDEKIELNRQTNATLEAIVQSTSKEWLSDFNFPDSTGEMVESEQGLIPNGWQVYSLGQLIDSASVTHKFAGREEIIFLNTSDIENGKVLNHAYAPVNKLPGQAKKSIRELDILFTEIRPANKRFALIDFDAEDYVVSTKLMVLRSKAHVHPIVIYFYLTNEETLSWLQHQAESRSGTFPQITFDHIKELKITLPPKPLLDKYTSLAWSSFQKIKHNEKEIDTLIILRDTLLPKLMSGEIEV